MCYYIKNWKITIK